MKLKDEVIWYCFDNVLPEPKRKIKVDLNDDIFDSETKMLENIKNEVILMANMVQSDESDWFVGMGWFSKCKWSYNYL